EIIDNPTADILNATGQHVCETPPFQLNASASFYDQFEWTTTGDGNFINASTLNPKYSPGPSDVSNPGSVQLKLTAAPIAPCEVAAVDQINIYFDPVASAIAGSDQTICETEQVQLDGTVNHASSVNWSTDGDGSFSNASTPDPEYTPGSGDIQNGSVILTLEAESQSPCTIMASDEMMLTIISLPSVNAGNDITTCEDDVASLNGVVVNNTSTILWSTSGDGTFSNPNIAEPAYFPGTDDINSGSVELTLTAQAISPCIAQATDLKTIQIIREPNADAGSDITACGGSSLNGSAQHYADVQWTTAGDGTFDDPYALNAVYTPGYQDIVNQSVELTLIAEPLTPCSVADEDAMTYNIDVPQIQSDNVTDQEVYTGEQLQLSFVGQSATQGTYTWYRNGEVIAGQNASSLIISSVEPEDAGDYQAIYGNGCGEVESNTALIEVLQPSTHQIALPQGWKGISSYIAPDDVSMDQVFSDIANDVVLVADQAGHIYWPGQNINTIGDWSVTDGYKIKMAANQNLFVQGNIRYPSLELSIPQGWSHLPVNTICAVNTEDVFGSLSGIKMIKDIAGTGIYWPEFGINTLQELYPGEAYQISNSGSAIDIKYPSCAAPMMEKTAEAEVVINHPWNEVQATPANHVFGFTAEALSNLEPGDVIGIFTADQICAGVMMINDNWQAAALTAFADDQLTESVDGFVDGEAVSFRVYRASVNQEFELSVSYGNSTVEQGTWSEGATTVIENLDYTTTSLGRELNAARLNVYPNPTSGQITLEFTGEASPDGYILIANANGQVVLEQEISRMQAGSKVQIDLSTMPRGVYYLRLVSSTMTSVEKIILE
ncbi:MAG: T9SS type A sorting domain-containing protein, partial [Bacteroidales bacterium]